MFIADYFNAYGFHHAAAVLSTVSGKKIDMLAPKAKRAVICVTIPIDEFAAMPAFKVFFTFLERKRHILALCLPWWVWEESDPGSMSLRDNYGASLRCGRTWIRTKDLVITPVVEPGGSLRGRSVTWRQGWAYLDSNQGPRHYQ